MLFRSEAQASKKVAIDIVKLGQLSGQPFEMLVRFLRMIQVQRQDFNGKVITVRGDDQRAISVPRLERLATFYSVPVDQLLPRQESVPVEGEAQASKKVAIDIVKLGQLSGQPFEMLVRFLRMIQVQRQDFNGKVITVRGDDQRAIAAMLDVPVDQVGARLDALDLLFRP